MEAFCGIRQRLANGALVPGLTMLFMILLVLISGARSAAIGTTGVKKYLEDYGYLDVTGEREPMDEEVQTSLRRFQAWMGLPDTGEADEQTLERMRAPRCGDSDGDAVVVSPLTSSSGGTRRRQKRYQIYAGQGWHRSDITYKISSYPDSLAPSLVDDAISRAFKLWSDVALLSITRLYSGKADIDISFQRLAHGDDQPFDGPGNVFGHAFPPGYETHPDLIGFIHLDGDEEWTVGTTEGTNLWLVAAHEIGHALGLSHSKYLPALMSPLYSSYDPDFQLDRDDILGIQFLYGARPGTEVSYPAEVSGPNNPSVPNLCAVPTGAFTFTIAGAMYAFKGNFYWKLEQGRIIPGYPKLISTQWNGLHSNLHAALSVKNTRVWGEDVGSTYFFKDRGVWKYDADDELADGFPKDIHTVFPNFHPLQPINQVQAAAEISGNGETLFLIDGALYLYNWERVFRGPVAVDEIIPNLRGNVISMFQGPDNFLYFFMDDGLYYQVSPWTFNISTFFPKPVAQDWFGCNEI